VLFIITLLTHTYVRVAILFTSRKQLNGWDYLKVMKNLKMSLLVLLPMKNLYYSATCRHGGHGATWCSIFNHVA